MADDDRERPAVNVERGPEIGPLWVEFESLDIANRVATEESGPLDPAPVECLVRIHIGERGCDRRRLRSVQFLEANNVSTRCAKQPCQSLRRDAPQMKVVS